jgi:hypothetical protein
LDTTSAGKAYDALLAVPGKSLSRNDADAMATALAALAPRLDPSVAPAKLAQATDNLMAAFDNMRDQSSWLYFTPSMSGIARRLDKASAIRLTDWLEAVQTRSLEETSTDHVCPVLLELWPLLLHADRIYRLYRVIRRVLSYDRQWGHVRDGAHYDTPAWIRCIGFVDSIPFLVELLRDPGCVGEFQSAVLARLEQLAYPDPGQAAVFAGLAADPLRAVTLPGLTLADDAHRKQHRRFRTVSDAARWLAAHHPDLDLDRPYHKAQGK